MEKVFKVSLASLMSIIFVILCIHTVKAQDTSPPDINITIARDKAVVGEKVNWLVSINLDPKQSLQNLRLESGDVKTWYWVMPTTPVGVLTTSQVMNIEMVPLIDGDLLPMLKATYTYSNVEQAHIIKGDQTILIEPVHKQVEIDAFTNRNIVSEGDLITTELWLINHSPFTLENIRIRGKGRELSWWPISQLEQLPSGEREILTLRGVVAGQRPQPQLDIEYTWVDDSSNPMRIHTAKIAGDPLAAKEKFLGKIPSEALGIIVGVITGGLTTFITGWINEHRKERSERKNDKQRVEGLIRLIVAQAKYAADISTSVELEPIETLFEQRGLFSVLNSHSFVGYIEKLWEAAIHHNQHLSSPSGSQRAQKLRKAIEKIEDKAWFQTSEKITRNADEHTTKHQN